MNDEPSVRGLTEDEKTKTAAEFFEGLTWEPERLDPRAMSAAEFLDKL